MYRPTLGGTVTTTTLDSARGFDDLVTQPRTQVVSDMALSFPVLAAARWAARTQAADQVAHRTHRTGRNTPADRDRDGAGLSGHHRLRAAGGCDHARARQREGACRLRAGASRCRRRQPAEPAARRAGTGDRRGAPRSVSIRSHPRAGGAGRARRGRCAHRCGRGAGLRAHGRADLGGLAHGPFRYSLRDRGDRGGRSRLPRQLAGLGADGERRVRSSIRDAVGTVPAVADLARIRLALDADARRRVSTRHQARACRGSGHRPHPAHGRRAAREVGAAHRAGGRRERGACARASAARIADMRPRC